MKQGEIDKIKPEKWIYCNRCKSDTRHECLLKSPRIEQDYMDDDEQYSFVEDFLYVIWKCRGCDSITLEERYTCEGYRNQNGEIIWDHKFYPIRTQNHIVPKYFNNLPQKLANVYKETLVAFNAGTRLLCATGLRSLIEGVCVNKNISGKNLEQMIDGLSELLPENIVINIHGLRFMGNVAIHELELPKTYDLRLAIEICEDLLNYLYELDYKTARLGKQTRGNK